MPLVPHVDDEQNYSEYKKDKKKYIEGETKRAAEAARSSTSGASKSAGKDKG